MAVVELRPERIEVVAPPSAAALLRRAADSMGMGIAEFLLDAAVKAAADVAGDRPSNGLDAEHRSGPHRADDDRQSDRLSIRLDTERWIAFNNVLDRPVTDNPRLRRLLTEKSVLE